MSTNRLAVLDALEEQAMRCLLCPLHMTRHSVVWSSGLKQQPPIAFVGEGPGQQEDEQGQPFCGPSGQLLDKMIEAMGYQRDHVYVTNIVKCRPPGNRTPSDVEAYTCTQAYLYKQLELVAPKVIVGLGRTAVRWLGAETSTGWRGRWTVYRGASQWPLPVPGGGNVPMMGTYHPAYLLRDPTSKDVVWEDLQSVMAKLRELV